jgi:nucleotide-binding universal stress UspA family protein
MFRSILVPLDGSPFAEVALPTAATVAKAAGAALRLLTVRRSVRVAAAVPDAGATGTDPTELRDWARTYLGEIAARMEPLGSGSIDCQVLEGPAGPAIVDRVGGDVADLIVMATHRRGKLGRFWLGGVANHVVRHASVPVLLIRPNEESSVPAAEIKLGSILVALDLSRRASEILPIVDSLARSTRATITLLHVAEPVITPADSASPHPMDLRSDLVEARRLLGQIALDAAAGPLRAHGHRVTTKVVVSAEPARTILAEVEGESGCDLIALTTRGAGGAERLLLGSVADQVIRGAECPVLVMRPGGVRERV